MRSQIALHVTVFVIASCLSSLALASRAASAEAIVTACGSDTQNGAGTNLAQAIASSGSIRFQCPANSVITVTGHYKLKAGLVMDGGGAVTLDGGGMQDPFITTWTPIALRNIGLRNFGKPPVLPDGSALHAFGDAQLDHVTLEASAGAFVIEGKAEIFDSRFASNTGTVIHSKGTLDARRNRFDGNEIALFMNMGTVSGSSFSHQSGTAITVGSSPTLIVGNSFTENDGTALAIGQGASGTSPVTMRANVFASNGGRAIAFLDMSSGPGGSVHVPFISSYNRFEANRAGAIAANLAHSAGMQSTGDIFLNNVTPKDGGVAAVTGGLLQISHALMRGNRAGGRGAAIFVAEKGQLGMPPGRALIANSLAIDNAGPGGIFEGGTITLTNVTVANNAGAGLLLSNDSARITNTLLSNNRPSDCGHASAAVLAGGNIASDGSCPGLRPTDSLLDTLYVPMAASPARGAGDSAACQAAPVDGVDLTFEKRATSGGCTAGAFEQAPDIKKLAAGISLPPETHANAADDFTVADGYKPPPKRPAGSSGSSNPGPGTTSPSGEGQAPDLIILAGLGIDYSDPGVPEWLRNSEYTPYPAVARALVTLLTPRHLKQPVYLDVIIWNYEHSTGVTSPRTVDAVNPDVLKKAILEGYNSRHQPGGRSFEDILL